MVAPDPVHRSGRAELAHPALAVGDDAEPHEGIRMTDVRGRKPPREVARHAAPRQMIALTTTTQDTPPDTAAGLTEGTDGSAVHGHAGIAHVSENNRANISALASHGRVQASLKFGFHRLELRLPPLSHRQPQHREPALTRLRAAMREAEEVKGLRLALATRTCATRRQAAEAQQSRLVGMQLETEWRKPLAQRGHEALGLVPMLEPDHEVIGKAHDDDIASRLLLSPLPNPEVEHIVQVEVGQERADAAALDRAHFPLCSLPVFQHAGGQPLLDEPHDAPVRHMVLDELHQPLVLQRIEEAANVGIEHPVHFLRHDADRERIKRLMRAATRPEPIGETEEVLFVDRVQYLDDGTLDDLVLQRGNTERPLPPGRLPDVRSANGLCPVRPPLQPLREVLEVLFQSLAVVAPRLVINPRGGVSLDAEIGRTPSFAVVDMVQERGEPLLPVPSCCLTYPLQRADRATPAL